MRAPKPCRASLPILLLLFAACSSQPITHENLHATLWNQTAAEQDALCLQTFELAALRLDQALADTGWSAALEQQGQDVTGLPPAIIADVDETLLDNSPYQARLVVEDAEYSSESWADWVEKRSAKALPGARDFLDLAHRRGVTIFYVTNRDATLEEATRANLEAEGMPIDLSRDVVLCRGENDWPSDKSSRRAEIAKSHRILLLLGDDLNDFVSGARVGDPQPRRELVEQYETMWGERWLLLPNAEYGSWEASLYGRDYSLDRDEKLRRKRAHLAPYRD